MKSGPNRSYKAYTEFSRIILSLPFLISCFLLLSFLYISQLASGISDFNFAAVGDWGCNSNTDNTVNNIAGKNPKFVFALGDYSYTSTGTCWWTKLSASNPSINGITKIAIGNHDNDDSEGFSGYMSHFGLSQTYYSYNYENVHILVLDTDKNSYSSGSSQYSFAVNDLQSASQNPNINWIIVYYHKPMYASPGSCCAGLTSLRDVYHPLFDQYGVDLVLQGHIHNYQRTFPLKYNSNSPSNPTITNGQANDYTDPIGQVFVTVGTGGVGFHSLSDKASFVSSQQASSFGQLDIKITNNGNKLEGRFYRNSNNAILDSFSITKSGNSAPFSNDQNVIVTKDVQQTITLTATDPNNDPLTYSIVTPPAHGTISPPGTGVAARTYTPATGYVGPDSFTFKANDGTLDSNIATVSITVQQTQQGGYHYTPSLALTGSNYQDTASSSTLQLNQFSVAAWFKTSTNFGSDAYIANKGGVGSDSAGQNLNYGIWMSSGEQIKAGFETSSGADQFVTSVNTYSDGQWHYAVVTNDGSNLRLYVDGVQVATKSTSSATPESVGTKPVRVGANSRITPPGNFFTGDVDEVRVWNDDLTAQQVSDAFAGNINTGNQVLYLPFGSNPNPVANDQAVTLNKNTQQPITLTATDPNNDPLTYSIVTPPAHGTLSGTAPNLAYDPTLDYVGPDSFTFKANDGTLDSNVATVSITVGESPVADDQTITVNKNTQQPITLTATDPNNDPLTYSIVTPPAHGTISPPGTGVAARTYTPATGYVGPDSFTFKANDGTLDSNIATVSITIQNGQPVANDQAVTLNKNTQQPITLTATDPNNDPLTYSIVTPPAHGTLSGTAPNLAFTSTTGYEGPDSFTFKANDGTLDSNIATVSITIQNGQPVANDQTLTLNKNTQQPITLTATDPNNDPLTYSIVTPPAHGTLSGTAPNLAYDPTLDYVGPDSFTFKANDGTLDSNVATVSITVGESPVADDQAITVNKNAQQPITLTATDPNNDPLTYSIVTPPAHGTISPPGTGVAARTYTPATGYVGPDSFTFKANDGTLDSNIATVSITIQNGQPVANDQTLTLNKNTQQPITLTATDPNNDPLTYSIVTPPAHGTLSGTAPNLAYDPTLDYVGPDSFTFKANDGTLDSNVATVSITVQQTQQGGYHYTPSLALTGSNYQDTASSSALQLNQFSVAAWFKTTTNFASDAYIVNKGGVGSDSAGENLNYGIWMTSTEQIKAGFETASGADQFITSVNTYNDGQWHYVVVTNDGSNLKLYVDGVQVATKSTSSATPESVGTKPVRVGANSRITPPGNFFTGDVDEVRVWNDDLTAQQVSSAFGGTDFTTAKQVLHLPFGASGSGGYNYSPSLALTGTNYNDTPDSAQLRVAQFSVAAWFKTTTNFGSDAYIVNKGGAGSDSAGENLNYGIWMTSTEQIKAGFETASGADQFITSVNTYNDGQWHYVVVTNDGSNLKLYVDGIQVATKSTSSATPESVGTKPVRVGANSRVTPPGNFFTGDVDEIRVWNDDLTAQQVSSAFGGTDFTTAKQVLYLPFGTASLTSTYNYGPSLSLTGPGT